MNATTLVRLLRWWPPFLFAGIRPMRIAPDFRQAEVVLHQRWYNLTNLGVHFGGSLFAMADPFYVIMLTNILGSAYYVWDRSATIEFLKPGRGSVSARFEVDEDTLAVIRANTAAGDKFFPRFTVDIVDSQGDIAAKVIKTLYVRKKPQARGRA